MNAVYIPSHMIPVSKNFPGYYVDSRRKKNFRVFSSHGVSKLTEIYRDPNGRYKLRRDGYGKWFTQESLLEVVEGFAKGV